MSQPSIEELRRSLAAAEAEVQRLRQALELAEWVRDYDAAQPADLRSRSAKDSHG
ncbi:hypothetical protein [Delftia acidovorans]|uniref:hypothetical protein n=1 Tax=Delftia acidovorans TaxID=80866 RepID=UPI0033429671